MYKQRRVRHLSDRTGAQNKKNGENKDVVCPCRECRRLQPAAHIYGGSIPHHTVTVQRNKTNLTLPSSNLLSTPLYRKKYQVLVTYQRWGPKNESKKRELSGAAKAAREAKLAHQEAQQNPIELDVWGGGDIGRSHLKSRGLFSDGKKG